MKLLFKVILFLIVFFCSCKPKHSGEKKPGLLSNLVDITDNEDKGIKEIIAFYGGQCEYGVQKRVYNNQDNETNFWLKCSKSRYLDTLEKIAELSGSNITYIFYKNLEKERSNYDQIQSELIFSDGGTVKFSYSVSQLEKVKSKIILVNKIVSLIKNKKFNDVANYLNVDTTLVKYDKTIVVSNLQKAELQFGNASGFVLYGFKFSKTDNGTEILHIAGSIRRDKQNNFFSVNVDPNTSEDKIYSLDYKL